MSNQQVTIQFPKDEQKRFAKGVTLTQIIKPISQSVAKKIIVKHINTTTTDLTRPILVNAEISLDDAHILVKHEKIEDEITLALWLAPKQVQIIGVSDIHKAYAEKVANKLRQGNIRVAIDGRKEKLCRKIRDAQMQKIPYILVLGDQEQENGVVTVGTYKQGGLNTLSIDAFIRQIQQEILRNIF